MADILIFENKDLSKVDQVAIALNDAGIPCDQKGKMGVLEFEFDELPPGKPSAGMDVSYLVYVSGADAGPAREIVDTFPFAHTPDPIPRVKKPFSPEFIRAINLIFLGLIAIIILFVVFMIL